MHITGMQGAGLPASAASRGGVSLRPVLRVTARRHRTQNALKICAAVTASKTSNAASSVSTADLDNLEDPEQKFRTYGSYFGKRHQIETDWLHNSPQVRVRQAADRAREQLIELAAMNERLSGQPAWRIRQRAEYLRTHIRNWDLIVNYVTEADAALTLHTIEEASRKVDEMLKEENRDRMSLADLRSQLMRLQGEVAAAQEKLNMTHARVEHNLQRVQELKAEAAALERLRGPSPAAAIAEPSAAAIMAHAATATMDAPVSTRVQQTAVADSPRSAPRQRKPDRGLRSTLDIEAGLRNYWFPIAFASRIDDKTLVPVDLFGQPWVVFRDEHGKVGCIRDECAHRACPLSIGKIENGKVVCPYHGWEYNRAGDVTKTPSTINCKGLSVSALPTFEKDGFVWVWTGDGAPNKEVPDVSKPPEGFAIHAEIEVEVPVEHGLLIENLLDLAHAPFTHTSTFARGWPIPDFVKFKTKELLSGQWDPYPIDMSFQPPCMTVSLIGLQQPGKIVRGSTAAACKRHLHQLHVCLPAKKGHTRLLYRMSMDFMPWLRHIPFIDKLWKNIAGQVLGEDLVLVCGQQDRMMRGGNTWANPVSYDKLAVRYRRWRNSVAGGSEASDAPVTMSSGQLFSIEDDEHVFRDAAHH